MFEGFDNGVLDLILDQHFAPSFTENAKTKIENVLQNYFDAKITLNIKIEKPKTATLAQKQASELDAKNKAMQKDFMQDEALQNLQETFNAKVDLNSIKERENV